MKKSLIIASVLCLPLAACHQETKQVYVESRPVKTAIATSQSIVSKEYAGMVEAIEYVTLSFPISGRINQLPINEGQYVNKGELIAAIGARSYTLQLNANKAEYETASAQLERNQRLLQQEAISLQEVEISQAQYEQAKTAYEVALSNLRDTKLYAPFQGYIERRNVENYQRIEAGQAIAVLVNTDKLRISFTIPDAYLYLLRSPQQSYQVTFDTYPNISFHASIQEVMNISTYSTGIPVTLTIDDPHFDRNRYEVKPGFTCLIEQQADITPFLDEPFVYVPLSAIFSDDNNCRTYVWVVIDNHVHLREVKLYAPTGQAEAIIQSGIQAGERVVTAGVYQLTEGEHINF